MDYFWIGFKAYFLGLVEDEVIDHEESNKKYWTFWFYVARSKTWFIILILLNHGKLRNIKFKEIYQLLNKVIILTN